jgi:hypothetical protein
VTTVITRLSKGSPLSNTEMDDNFTNLNTYKLENITTGVTTNTTITPPSANSQYNVTALASDLVIAAPSGTPISGHRMILRIKDNGVSRALTWNATYFPIDITLPATTTAGKVLYIGIVYNDIESRWDVIAIAQEA